MACNVDPMHDPLSDQGFIAAIADELGRSLGIDRRRLLIEAWLLLLQAFQEAEDVPPGDRPSGGVGRWTGHSGAQP